MTTEIATDNIYALAYGPGPHTCFAARESGLYRSDDAGQSWRLLFAGVNLEAPLATTAVLAVRDAAGLSVFAGVPGGLLRSHDCGVTWQATSLPSAPTVSALAASPRYGDDGTLFAATLGDGVLLSVDRGGSWAHWSFGLLDQDVLCLAVSPDFERDRTLYAGAETGLYRSTNGGRSWRELALPCDAPVTSIGLPPPGMPGAPLLIGTDGAGLWRSNQPDKRWSICSGVSNDCTVVSIGLRQHAVGQLLLHAATDAAVIVSYDGGDTWTVVVKFDQASDQIRAAASTWDGHALVLGHADGRTASVEIPRL